MADIVYGILVHQPLSSPNWVPVDLPTQASALQATVTQTQTTLTNSTGGTATSDLAAFAGVLDNNKLNDNFTEVSVQLARIKVDMAALIVLVHALRTALIDTTIIKGSA